MKTQISKYFWSPNHSGGPGEEEYSSCTQPESRAVGVKHQPAFQSRRASWSVLVFWQTQPRGTLDYRPWHVPGFLRAKRSCRFLTLKGVSTARRGREMVQCQADAMHLVWRWSSLPLCGTSAAGRTSSQLSSSMLLLRPAETQFLFKSLWGQMCRGWDLPFLLPGGVRQSWNTPSQGNGKS